MASQSGNNDAGSSGLGIQIFDLRPGDLPSNRLLGTGLASVGYETELNGEKCARKDFMGVPSGTFRREAARLVGLEDHINVVKTLGWTENNMSCSLVVEYMDDDLLGILQKWQWKQSQGSMEAGPNSGNESDLDSRSTIKLAPFELPEALDLMLQIARGMEYLADKGIRHGNLKTKNVLVTRSSDRDGNSLSVKVSDFGLVRTRRKSRSFASRQARKLDMARWTAPELLEGFLLEDEGFTSSESDSDEDCTDSSDLLDRDVPEWRELGADVYSFAVICSQILTGEDPYPYPNLNWKELGVKIVRHGLKPALPAACPPELRELLASCWGFDRLFLSLRERPSFSHIRRSLERLQQMDFPAHHLHESLPLAEKAPMSIERMARMEVDKMERMKIERMAQMDRWRNTMTYSESMVQMEIDKMERMKIERMAQMDRARNTRMEIDNMERMKIVKTVWMEIERMPQLDDLGRSTLMVSESMAPMAIKRVAAVDVVRTKDQLRQPMPVKEPTDVVREIGLREPVTVEDLWGDWGPECLQHGTWRPLRPPADTKSFFATYLQTEMLTLDVASLITRTRTVVRCRTQWTQLREELQLMLPDVLRMRNRWVGYEKASDGNGLYDLSIWTIPDGWARKLKYAVFYGLHEVQKLEDDDPSLLWRGEFPEPQRLSQCRRDIKELAKVRKKALLDVTRALSRAQRAKELAKEAAEPSPTGQRAGQRGGRGRDRSLKKVT